jgi:hypothetical protein
MCEQQDHRAASEDPLCGSRGTGTQSAETGVYGRDLEEHWKCNSKTYRGGQLERGQAFLAIFGLHPGPVRGQWCLRCAGGPLLARCRLTDRFLGRCECVDMRLAFVADRQHSLLVLSS